jgi:glucokinase
MTPVLAIDIGGTAIKIGIVATRGQMLRRRLLPFDNSLQFDALVEHIHAACTDLLADVAPAPGRIAIATPGYSPPGSGRLVDGAGNVPALRDRSICAALSERFGLPASVENDGIAAARGEMLYGAGRNYRRFAVMTIGTGIGGAVVIDDAVIAGSNGEPPEFGAIVVGETIGARPMSLEASASAPALVAAFTRVAGHRIDSAESVFAALSEGDPHALQIVDRSCRHIAQAFGMLVNALSLDACIIGGGVSGAGAILCDRVRAHLPDFTWPLLMSRVEVVISTLGNDAGLLGVAADLRRAPGRAHAPLSTPA